MWWKGEGTVEESMSPVVIHIESAARCEVRPQNRRKQITISSPCLIEVTGQEVQVKLLL